MLTVSYPWLALALPLPWLVYRFLPHATTSYTSSLHVPFLDKFTELAKHTSHNVQPHPWRLFASCCAWLLLVLAACGPKWLGDPINLPLTGRDLMVVLDISGSMQIPDMQLAGKMVDRLTLVKKVANDFISKRQGDRVGLVLFGTQAYIQVPLTYDRATVAELLNDASIGLAGQQTAIGDALGMALKHLQHSNNSSRVIILLTDGMSNAGSIEPLAAAELIRQQQIPVYTIGLGAESLILDTVFGQQRINPAKELDENTLKAIAQQTGGLYFRAKDTAGLQAIYKTIDKLHPNQYGHAIWRPEKQLYLWPLSLALLLSLVLCWRYLSFPRVLPATLDSGRKTT
jgi:Ca-activated chloride channel homolog